MKIFKKITSMLLTAGILTTSLPIYSAAAVIGDLNDDGVIDKTDVTIFARYFAGWPMEEKDKEKMLTAGDVNGDEEVIRADAMELARSVDGWDDENEEYIHNIYVPENDENLVTDSKSHIQYYNNMILVFLFSDVSDDYKSMLADAVNGTVVGEIDVSINFLQIMIPETNYETILRSIPQKNAYIQQ